MDRSSFDCFLKTAATPFLVSRFLVLFLLAVCGQLHIESVPAVEGASYHLSCSMTASDTASALRRIWNSADGRWYLEIAAFGYDSSNDFATPHNWVFFPLYPLLLRAFSALTGKFLISGVLLSNVCFLAGLIFLQALMKRTGSDAATIERACWILCFFPTSYFFSSPLTESLFFLLTSASLFALTSEYFLLSALLFSLATATRPTGVLMFPGYCVLMFSLHPPSRLRLPLNLFVALSGVLLYAVWLTVLTGHPFAFIENQSAWGRAGPHGSLLKAMQQLQPNLIKDWSFTAVQLLCVLAGSVTIVHYLFKKNPGPALMVLIPLAAALSTGTLLSLTRIMMPIPPLTVGLAQIVGKRRLIENAVLVVEAALLALLTAMYGLHVTAGMT